MKKLKKTLQIILIAFVCMVSVSTEKAYAADGNGNLVIILDAGHDATHAGAQNGDLGEEDLVIKIAQYCQKELEKYAGIKVYMTRDGYTCVNGGSSITSTECNAKRVQYATALGADLYISFHLNSSKNTSAHGVGVYYPNSNYRPNLGRIGYDVANNIFNELRALGIDKWSDGVIIRNSEDGTLYPDSSLADYLGIIRRSKEAGIPAVLIEHVFLSNSSDVQKFLSSDEKLKNLGLADAKAIIEYYELKKKTDPAAYSASGTVKIKNVNTVSGTFDIVVSNVSSSDGIGSVEVPVWSTKNQSDLVWYKAKKQADGTYVAHVDVANHNCNFTTYNVDTYVKTLSGIMKKINGTKVKLNAPKTQINAGMNSDCTQIAVNAWHVPGTLGKSIKSVSFAVWSKEKGQDDLRWYTAKLNGDKYYVDVPIENHMTAGECLVHVYANYANGKNVYLANKTVSFSQNASAKIEIKNRNTVSGTFDVVVSEASVLGGVQKVEVPVWSMSNQKDIVWYTAVKQANGTYVAHVDVANHNCNFTKYNVHTYITSTAGKRSRVGTVSVNISAPTEKVQASVNGDASALALDAWHVPGTLGKSLKGVSFAVWSAAGGQDDLKWYTGKLSGDKYVASASLLNHTGEGTYHVHAYAQYSNGANKYIGSCTTNVAAISVGNIQIKNLNNVSGSFDVVISNVVARTGVQQVQVPVWSKGNQSDIVWYNAVKQSDGTYTVHVDVANHNCNFAKYNVHVYVKNKKGDMYNVGTQSANLNTPGAKVNAIVNDNCSEISLDAWHIPGTFGKSLKGVSFAVWSDEGGQNDLRWYTASASGDHYVAKLDMSHHTDVGLYHVHVYAERPSGRTLVKGTTFNRPLTPIMGSSSVTAQQLVSFYRQNEVYPEFYKNSDAPTLEAFCQIYVEECAIEGVRVEVAFAQAMLETGFMRYKGDVDISQYNFAGIGATGGGNPGNSFSSVREGVRAQIQHLKAYASSDGLKQACVDPRFSYVTRESAPYLEWLGIQENPYGKGWATGKNYGYNIRDRYVYKILQQ